MATEIKKMAGLPKPRVPSWGVVAAPSVMTVDDGLRDGGLGEGDMADGRAVEASGSVVGWLGSSWIEEKWERLLDALERAEMGVREWYRQCLVDPRRFLIAFGMAMYAYGPVENMLCVGYTATKEARASACTVTLGAVAWILPLFALTAFYTNNGTWDPWFDTDNWLLSLGFAAFLAGLFLKFPFHLFPVVNAIQDHLGTYPPAGFLPNPIIVHDEALDVANWTGNDQLREATQPPRCAHCKVEKARTLVFIKASLVLTHLPSLPFHDFFLTPSLPRPATFQAHLTLPGAFRVDTFAVTRRLRG
ncbi:putative transmembrane protein [Gregarina niphandrodes]|uniref:Transmembrane protein n=1 Tax=Gregarina niphandrodes TaxID=110365 RepID=A0A023BD68_GRENI|nr:putative transmembrane protein [Gregarina niphandrodes]EZG87106.1 putative transmembrane protein [Gregarina niphandrodes]|eukprot:XP_011128703.1 putative transmembrane protein [Gregarina niphandrodes]